MRLIETPSMPVRCQYPAKDITQEKPDRCGQDATARLRDDPYDSRSPYYFRCNDHMPDDGLPTQDRR